MRPKIQPKEHLSKGWATLPQKPGTEFLFMQQVFKAGDAVHVAPGAIIPAYLTDSEVPSYFIQYVAGCSPWIQAPLIAPANAYTAKELVTGNIGAGQHYLPWPTEWAEGKFTELTAKRIAWLADYFGLTFPNQKITLVPAMPDFFYVTDIDNGTPENKVVTLTRKKAEEVAEAMAALNPGDRIVILEPTTQYKYPKTALEVTEFQ